MTLKNIDEIRSLLEKDLEWRTKELSFVRSFLNNIAGNDIEEIENKKRIFRKSIVLSLYAHFEGYFKYSFEIYAMVLNESNLSLDKVIDVLFVSSLDELFITYDDSNKWLVRDPENKRSERIMNRVRLLSQINLKSTDVLKLPIASGNFKQPSVVATESNLTPEVINKILYGLGIHMEMGVDKSQFMKMMGMISQLVVKRNGIAHGDNKAEYKKGVSEKEFDDFENLFRNITKLISPIITKSLIEKKFLKEEHR